MTPRLCTLIVVDHAQPTRSFDELADLVRRAPSSTSDDVSITMDGRHIDTKEKALAFLAEIEAERAAGVTVDDLLKRSDDRQLPTMRV